jgi:hypothetical protein
MISNIDVATSYHRRIELTPRPGGIVGEMEDHHHHFRVELGVEDDVVVSAEASSPRSPWSTCLTGAQGVSMLIGRHLTEAADRGWWYDNKANTCTHVSDLSQLAVQHAFDGEPCRYDIWMFPVDQPDRRICLLRNGVEVFDWELHGDSITSGDLTGTSLEGRELAVRVAELYGDSTVEPAMVLRRAASIGLATAMNLDAYVVAGDIRTPDSACYTYRPEVAFTARRRVGASRPWAGGPTHVSIPPPTAR